MAEKKASLIITLQDTASAALHGLESSIQSMKSAWVETTVVVGAVAAEVYKAITAFGQHEAAVNRLNLALKSTTTDSSSASGRLGDLAAALSKTTGVSETTITSFQGMLASMGFNEAAIAQMTPRILDMSRAMGVDASTAAMVLGRSIENGTGMSLKRYGLTLQDAAFKNRDFGAIMDQIDSKVKGQAESYGNTAVGGIEKFKAALEKLQERIGQVLSEALGPLIQKATEFIEKNNWIVAGVKILTASFVEMGQIFTAVVGGILSLVTATMGSVGSLVGFAQLLLEGNLSGAVAAAKQGVQDWKNEVVSGVGNAGSAILKATQDARARMADAWNGVVNGPTAPKKTGGGPTAAPNTGGGGQPFDDQEFQIKLAQIKGYHAQAQILEMQHQLKLRQIDKDSAQGRALLDATYRKIELDSADKFFGDLATLQKSKNKEMQEVGKAAATAQAIISTYTAATEAYQSLALIPFIGPELGAAAAAAAITSGMANVAAIQGVALAEGGMALPTGGGTLARIGEAGKAEAVIPLDDPRTKEKLADVMGGNHITIQAGTIIASDYDIVKFARRIDEELYKLQRNRKSVAN